MSHQRIGGLATLPLLSVRLVGLLCAFAGLMIAETVSPAPTSAPAPSLGVYAVNLNYVLRRLGGPDGTPEDVVTEGGRERLQVTVSLGQGHSTMLLSIRWLAAVQFHEEAGVREEYDSTRDGEKVTIKGTLHPSGSTPPSDRQRKLHWLDPKIRENTLKSTIRCNMRPDGSISNVVVEGPAEARSLLQLTATDIIRSCTSGYEVMPPAASHHGAKWKGRVLLPDGSLEMDYTWADTVKENGIEYAVIEGQVAPTSSSAGNAPKIDMREKVALSLANPLIVRRQSTSTVRYSGPAAAATEFTRTVNVSLLDGSISRLASQSVTTSK